MNVEDFRFVDQMIDQMIELVTFFSISLWFAILYKFHRVLANRLAVTEALFNAFDETFLLDCLNEFNLNYLVNQSCDPLNVVTTEKLPAERILSG